MKISTFIVSVFVALIFSLVMKSSANAELIDNGDGTITQIRNDGTMLMWLQDALTAVTTGYCTQDKIDSGVCNANSQMTWYEAVNNWIPYLNDNYYLGYNDWRLPEVNPVNGVSFNYDLSYDGSTDHGYNISAPGSAYPGSTASEFAYLYYTELGNLGYYDTSGNPAQPGFGLNNTGPFTNLTAQPYWTGTTHGLHPSGSQAWRFSFYDYFPIESYNGYQEPLCKTCPIHVWAVRSAGYAPEIIKMDGIYYYTLRSAYDAATDGDIIQVQAVTITEDLKIDRGIVVELKGGYSDDFTTQIGITALIGDITISDGMLTIDNFAIDY